MGYYNVTPQLPPNGLTIVDLFCGGGLGAVGMEAAGFDIIAAYDNDKRAVEAYRYNFGDHVRLADINELDAEDIPDADVFFGGPPCQDFSVAGTGAGEKGERGKLVWTYLRIIEAKKPKAFIFENVKGLITKRHRPTFDALIEKFEEIGYDVSWKLINAWDYGVAQKRERVFIVGIRKDLGFTYEFPKPSPEDYRTQVLRDVIGDLPEPTQQVNGGRSMARFRGDGTQGDKIVPLSEPSPTIRAEHHGNIEGFDPSEIANHDPQPLSEKALDYLQRDQRHLQKHRPPTVDEPSQTLPAVLHKGVPYGLFYPSTHTALPLSATDEQAAKHVPNGGNWLVPDRTKQAPRRFTVRECLRIQSVPDWYVLPDTLSLSAQYRIVGNGIPSRVAWYLGRALAAQLKEAMAYLVTHSKPPSQNWSTVHQSNQIRLFRNS